MHFRFAYSASPIPSIDQRRARVPPPGFDALSRIRALHGQARQPFKILEIIRCQSQPMDHRGRTPRATWEPARLRRVRFVTRAESNPGIKRPRLETPGHREVEWFVVDHRQVQAFLQHPLLHLRRGVHRRDDSVKGLCSRDRKMLGENVPSRQHLFQFPIPQQAFWRRVKLKRFAHRPGSLETGGNVGTIPTRRGGVTMNGMPMDSREVRGRRRGFPRPMATLS